MAFLPPAPIIRKSPEPQDSVAKYSTNSTPMQAFSARLCSIWVTRLLADDSGCHLDSGHGHLFVLPGRPEADGSGEPRAELQVQRALYVADPDGIPEHLQPLVPSESFG